MQKRALSLLLLFVMIFSVITTGCSKNEKEKTENENVIKVGWMGSLTGDQAVWGQCELNAVKMIFDDINKKGGVLGKKLEVIGYDTKGDA